MERTQQRPAVIITQCIFHSVTSEMDQNLQEQAKEDR